MQRAGHAGNVLRHHGRVGGKTTAGQHQAGRLHTQLPGLKLKTLGQPFDLHLLFDPADARPGHAGLPEARVQGRPRGRHHAVKAPRAMAWRRHVGEELHRQPALLGQELRGRRQGLGHGLGNVLVDHAWGEAAQIVQPGLGAVTHASGALQVRACGGKQTAAQGEVVRHTGMRFDQQHLQAPGLRGQGHEHAGSARAQNHQVRAQISDGHRPTN